MSELLNSVVVCVSSRSQLIAQKKDRLAKSPNSFLFIIIVFDDNR